MTASLIVVGFVGLIATQYGLAVLRDVRDTLPAVPDVATLPVSTEVVDNQGRLLRPFTTDGGRWRLPVEVGQV
ncbi:MAG TPA: hypothetical protein VGD86_11285, partial [Devosia sp.]